jgi:branched-chain amino acid transport system substrate-binding protein
MHGFNLQLLPVTAPGVDQKATWLQVRQAAPTTCCCGAGVS